MQYVRRRIVEFNPLTAVKERLILWLRDVEQVLEYLRMSLELSLVDLESSATSHENNVSVMKPDICSGKTGKA